jgi:hypothetical protein
MLTTARVCWLYNLSLVAVIVYCYKGYAGFKQYFTDLFVHPCAESLDVIYNDVLPRWASVISKRIISPELTALRNTTLSRALVRNVFKGNSWVAVI